MTVSSAHAHSDYALEKESKEIIKSGPPPPRYYITLYNMLKRQSHENLWF